MIALWLLGGAALVALLIWVIARSVRRQREIRAEWQQYVAGLRAEATGRFPECKIRMLRDGLAVEIHQWTETSGSGDDRSTESVGQIRVWPSRPGLDAIRIGPQGWFGKLIGLPDLQIGEADFDKAFMISAPSVERVKSLLGPEARRALVAAREAIDIALSEGALVWRGKMLRRPAQAEQQLRYLVGLAKTIDAAG